MLSPSTRRTALGNLAIFTLAGTSAAQVALTPVALTGQASGVGSSKFVGFSGPVASGEQVAFVARLSGKGVSFTNDQAVIVRSERGKFVPVARSGSVAPGLRNAKMNSFDDLVLGNDGGVAFSARLVGAPGGILPAVIQGRAGALRLVVKGGDAAGGGSIDDLAPPVMNPSGQVALVATLQDGSRALFASASAGDARAWRTGTPIASLGGAALASVGSPAINASGMVAFQGFLQDPDPGSSDDAGVFAVTGATLTRPVGEGAAASNLTGASVRTFSTPSLNDAGGLAFMSMLSGPGVGPTNDLAVLVGDRSVARLGESLPGGLKLGVPGAPLLDADGRAVVLTTVMGPGVTAENDLALWSIAPDGVRTLVAREGELVFAKGGLTITQLRSCAAAGNGRVVFGARVLDGQQPREALLSWDPRRGPVVIAMTGDTVATARTQTKKLLSLEFAAGSGGQDGRPACVTASGDAVFRGVFDDKAEAVLLAALPAALCDVASVGGALLSDGQVTRDDLTAFLAAFASGDPAADVAGRTDGRPGGDGTVDNADMDAFLASYEAARP